MVIRLHKLYFYECIDEVLASDVEVAWHAISTIKKFSQLLSLALFDPLDQELIAVCVLSVSADHTPSLLSQSAYYGEYADA